MRPALLHARVFCRQALDNARLGADGGDRLADVIVQLAGDLLPHALFRLQQAFSQTPVARQLGLQGLVQLAQHLHDDLRGVPLSTFVRDAVLRETENVMAAELSVALSAEESRRFLAALDKPFAPNPQLLKAMERGLARR